MTPTPRDEHEQKALDDVERHGLHIVHVLEEGDLPPFSYTVGLYHTFGHPEVLVYGLPNDSAHSLLNHLASQLREGKKYVAGGTYSDLLDGFRATFRVVPLAQYREHVGWATWFNERPDFPVLQLIYPDRQGQWPWDSGASDGFRHQQMVLADARRTKES